MTRAAATTAGIAVAALSSGAIVVPILVRVLQHLERDPDDEPGHAVEPAWWGQFERQFAGYVAERNEQAGSDQC